MTDETLTTPAIHLNGTSAARLAEDYVAAHDAVEAALEALAKTAPHGRDYYVQGHDSFLKARTEFELRQAALVRVMAELRALALHCLGKIR